MTQATTTSVRFEEVLVDLDDRGRGFEELSAWFLLNDPEWRARVNKVWRWDDWPGRWGPDRGIDLVAETTDGDLIAVQCKHYHPTHAITKAEVDSFLSESNRAQFSERVLVATTRNLAAGARQVIEAQEKPVSLALRDRLKSADVDWAAFAADDVSPLQWKSPKPHQERAIAAVVQAFERDKRGQLLMPCGTGKTLTSLWIAERLQARRVLVLLPTLALLRQTVQVWRAEAAEPFGLLKVCSEKGETDDEIVAADLTPAEVGGSVTTDPAQIATFLGGPGRRVVFCTYKSSPRIAEALAAAQDSELDLVICDEAHWCAGLEDRTYKAVLDDSKIPAARRLFVTATPTVFSASAKDQAANARTKVASMDDRAVFGRVFHRLSFKQAVDEELLCPYRVVLMPVRSTEVAELVRRRTLVTMDGGDHITDAYNLAAQIACLRTLHEFDCRRLVAFHPTVDESRQFVKELELAADLLDADERPAGFQAAHVDGYMTRSRRDRALGHFTIEDDLPRLLSNVRLLAEGVDVPGIDAICLVGTHRGASAIVQAVGRVVRNAPGKRIGTVLLPVLVEGGQTEEEALRSSEHRPVLEVLAALLSIDTEIRHTVDAVRLELGPRPPRHGDTGRWVVSAPTEVDEEFAAAIEVCLVDLLAARRSESDEKPVARGRLWDPSADDVVAKPDWSTAETFEQAIEATNAWHRENGYQPLDRWSWADGFPIGRWWLFLLGLLEDGVPLDDQLLARCAARVNYAAVSMLTYPRARARLARAAPSDLAARLDDWLANPWDCEDITLRDHARANRIGPNGLRSEELVPHVPDDLAGDRRLAVAEVLLKITGDALAHADAEISAACQGYLFALCHPDEPHGIDGRLRDRRRRPYGVLACHLSGWHAGQDAVKWLAGDLTVDPEWDDWPYHPQWLVESRRD